MVAVKILAMNISPGVDRENSVLATGLLWGQIRSSTLLDFYQKLIQKINFRNLFSPKNIIHHKTF